MIPPSAQLGMDNEKLTLSVLCSLRFPRRDKSGKVYMTKRFQWTMVGNYGQILEKHWTLDFDIDRWDWFIELAAQIPTFENGDSKDPNWEKSEYVTMWLGNHDPNRFLVGISLHTLQDLTRFFDAFKLEYYREQSEAKRLTDA